jgi:hypothetical protein
LFLASALVAQRIEQRFPKPRVAGSIPAGGTRLTSIPRSLCALVPLALPEQSGRSVEPSRLYRLNESSPHWHGAPLWRARILEHRQSPGSRCNSYADREWTRDCRQSGKATALGGAGSCQQCTHRWPNARNSKSVRPHIGGSRTVECVVAYTEKGESHAPTRRRISRPISC